jgi:hypothetical protein
LSFLIASKAFQTWILEKIYERKKKNLGGGKGRPLSRDLDCKGKMFANFYYFIYFSCSSFNFYNFFIDYLCKFSIKLSSALILEKKKDKNLFVENQNKESICGLSPS